MISQENRLIRIDTSLGQDVLLLTGFEGDEAISTPFGFKLSLISEDHALNFQDIIGQPAVVTIFLADGKKRFFHGIISAFSQGKGGGDSRYAFYKATLVPWVWILSRIGDSRIFQEMSVPDIVEKVFRDRGFSDFSLRLHGSYDKRTYCVQYRETDLNFVSRLLEEEGIYYFFEHEENKHTLIIADAPEEHPLCPNQSAVRYQLSSGGWLDEDVITELDLYQEIRPGKMTLNDFNFEIPNTDLKVSVSTKNNLGPGDREIYDYPGEFDNRGLGDRLVSVRMEEEEAQITSLPGKSDCRTLVSGYRFTLTDFYRPDMDKKDFVLRSVRHEAYGGGDYPGAPRDADKGPYYINRFTCMPYDVPFRPIRKTRRPVVDGVQTAIVVGPSGEEIYTDEHGRVKVQFHWDREGTRDEKSSCWIRVSQVCAGAGWGAIDVPRIGHEVIVDFIEGDPDRPIITGRVYHGNNRPPFGLPAAGMVSGMKSNSTPGGGGYNEFTLDDTKGKEKIVVHGQYDMESTIEHDQTLTVNNNRTDTIMVDDSETVGNNQTLNVGVNQTVTIGSNQSTTIGANHTVAVGATESISVGAAQSVSVGASKTETIAVAKALSIGGAYQVSVGGAMNETVGAAKAEEIGGAKVVAVGGVSTETIGSSKSVSAGSNITETAGGSMSSTAGGKMSLTADGDISATSKGKVLIDAASEIVLKCGGASITMKSGGEIVIKGSDITIKGSGGITAKAGGTMTLKGSTIKEN